MEVSCMATLNIPDEKKTLSEFEEVRAQLATMGIDNERWHDEDEVRFIIEGRGIFHIHPRYGKVVSITVEAGDLLRVPRGTWHWFDLCEERRIRAIRLFQDTSGWRPHYTESGVDSGYEPVCFGPNYFPGRANLS